MLQVHPEYDERCRFLKDIRQIDRLAYYLEGGDAFPVEKELRWKPLELSSNKMAGPSRQARVGASFYTNYFEDSINDLVSQMCKDPLCIEGPDGDDYWNNFQDCVDGAYTTATTMARKSFTQNLVFDRSFYLVRFPAEVAPENQNPDDNLQTQDDAGALDAQVLALDTIKVNDWKLDPSGNGLTMARMYEIELIGDGYKTELHKWTYFTAKEIGIYTAVKQVGQDFKVGATAALLNGKTEPHDFKVCPVFNVNRKIKTPVGKKLLPPARQLFNEESDASYYRLTTITGSLFIFTDSPGRIAKGLQLSPFGAPVLRKDDRIERDKVDPATIQALDAATANRRGQLRGLIHEMARQSSSQSASGQNTSRMPAARAVADADPLGAWLLTFVESEIAVWKRMIQAICDVRGDDDDEIEVSGLMGSVMDEDDGVTTENMQAEQIFQALPFVPDEAKQERGKAIGIRANPDVDEVTLKKITKLQKPPKPQPTGAGGPEVPPKGTGPFGK